MGHFILIFVLFTGPFAKAACGPNLLTPEQFVALPTLSTRPVASGDRLISAELRAVLREWHPEYLAEDLKPIVPALKKDFRLEDKVESTNHFGLSALVLEETPVALIKWEPHPLFRSPEYAVASASQDLERGPIKLRRYLLRQLNRRDAWAQVLPAGFGSFAQGRFDLNPSAPANLIEHEQTEVVRILYGTKRFESNRIVVRRDLGGDFTLSVRRAFDPAGNRTELFGADQGARVIDVILRELNDSPAPFDLEKTDYLTLQVRGQKFPILKIAGYVPKDSLPIKIMILADDKSHDPNFPGWPLFNADQAIRALSARLNTELLDLR